MSPNVKEVLKIRGILVGRILRHPHVSRRWGAAIREIRTTTIGNRAGARVALADKENRPRLDKCRERY